MADKPKYSTIQQHQPLYAPKGWSEEEKRFVRTLQGILEDIYKRYGRLTVKDLGEALNETIADEVAKNELQDERIRNSVSYNTQNGKTDAQKQQARENINAAKNAVMSGATSGASGSAGLVPAPSAGSGSKLLFGNGSWGTIPRITNSDIEEMFNDGE